MKNAQKQIRKSRMVKKTVMQPKLTYESQTVTKKAWRMVDKKVKVDKTVPIDNSSNGSGASGSGASGSGAAGSGATGSGTAPISLNPGSGSNAGFTTKWLPADTTAINPINNCACYQQQCACQGQIGCGCCQPACACAPALPV